MRAAWVLKVVYMEGSARARLLYPTYGNVIHLPPSSVILCGVHPTCSRSLPKAIGGLAPMSVYPYVLSPASLVAIPIVQLVLVEKPEENANRRGAQTPELHDWRCRAEAGEASQAPFWPEPQMGVGGLTQRRPRSTTYAMWAMLCRSRHPPPRRSLFHVHDPDGRSLSPSALTVPPRAAPGLWHLGTRKISSRAAEQQQPERPPSSATPAPTASSPAPHVQHVVSRGRRLQLHPTTARQTSRSMVRPSAGRRCPTKAVSGPGIDYHRDHRRMGPVATSARADAKIQLAEPRSLSKPKELPSRSQPSRSPCGLKE
jgi:hypothetical protein